eukprot:5404271-Amphidinium_carterae.1
MVSSWVGTLLPLHLYWGLTRALCTMVQEAPRIDWRALVDEAHSQNLNDNFITSNHKWEDMDYEN